MGEYNNALNALYASFPNVVYVTVNPFAVNVPPAVAAGIGVPRSNIAPSHQTDAVLALRQLDSFGAGRGLLQAICMEIANKGHRCGIRDAHGTFSGGNECAITVSAQGQVDDYRTQLTVALNSNRGAVGGCIAAAMTALGHPPGAGAASFTWLVGQIDAMPILQLLGLPNAIPSSNVHGQQWISAATLINWVNNNAQYPAPLTGQQRIDAEIVLGAVLYGGRVPNLGGHTTVSWNASNLTAAGVARPPYIGLGHELIHALHNQRGEQPGNENGTTTTVLYEYLCVGLGPFAALPNTENALRAAVGIALRPSYG
jgi:hypothetical protein